MLSIARALLINPRLLILDEPSQGLAPLIVREVFRIVAQMRADGISVLLVEQNVRAALEIADHAYVLENGEMVYSAPAAELAADEAAHPGPGRRVSRGMVARRRAGVRAQAATARGENRRAEKRSAFRQLCNPTRRQVDTGKPRMDNRRASEAAECAALFRPT